MTHKPIIYQVFTRLYGNRNTTRKEWGSVEENGTGKFSDFDTKTLKAIKQNLIAQLTAPVKWTYEVQQMLKDGATDFVECGPGKALQGMIAKIAKDVEGVTISGIA